MKKTFTLLFFLPLTFILLAQAPEKMSYQFVIRNSTGALIANQGVGVRISIRQGAPAGGVVYAELFNPNPVSNANGLVTVEIGTGLVIMGDFSAINWASGLYYLKTEVDPTGATDYTIIGTSQLISVPYALYSKTAESIADNSVTSAKIVNGSVTAADLDANSVGSYQIADGTVIGVDLGDNSVSGSKIVDLSIGTADLLDNSVTSAKIAESTIMTADLNAGSVTSSTILDGTVANVDLANNSVNSSKIADGTITAADIEDRTRHISFPANALNFEKSSTILTQTRNGITWKSDYANDAFLTISKPLDWQETTNVTMKLYFMVTTNSSGNVAFFIRPRSFNEGDTFADASSINAVSPVSVPANSIYKIYSQSFNIPYSRFGTKNLWVISIQREGTGETFTDDLILMAVELIYTAEQ